MGPGASDTPAGSEAGARVSDRRLLGLVAATGAGCYANALTNGFALDDNDVIARNPLVHTLAGMARAFVHSYWPESTGAGQYRPLTIASFTLDWSLSHGATAWLHAVNIAWHVAACLLLWRLLSTMVSRAGATAGALTFAVHPVHVEAVANLVGRAELMCTVFVLAALLAHRRARWAAVPLYAAALVSKETGIAFLGLAVAADLLLVPDTPPSHTADSWPSNPRRRRLYAAYAVVTAIYGVWLAVLFHGHAMLRVAAPWAHSPTSARWLTAIGTAFEYLRLMVFPLGLHVDYMPQVVPIAFAPTARVVLGALVIAGAVVAAVRVRHTAPPLAFALAAFAVAVAPVANLVFATGIVMAERTLYLPSIGLAIAVGCAWDALERRRVERPGARALPLDRALLAVVLAMLVVRTWVRTPVWRSTKTAMVASLRDEPESYRAHERVADVMERAGDTAAAVREYGIARSLYPRDPYLYQAAASMLVRRGDAGVAAADRLLDSARLIDPGVYADLMRRAWVRYAAGDYRGAIGLARRAYLSARDSTDAIMMLTQAAQRIDDVPDADAAFRLALADHPADRSLHHGYANMLMSIGDSAAASRERQKAGADRY